MLRHPLLFSLLVVAIACDDPIGRGVGVVGGVTPLVEAAQPPAAIVLRGTILTPTGAIKHGYVGVANGRIVSVSDKQPAIAGALTINTEGVILPGFVDAHNHVPWNVFPRWQPGRLFTNRNQWRNDAEYRQRFADPFDRLTSNQFCDMNAWGELRALVGGATSTMTTQPFPCIHGLVRNLDYNSGFYGTIELDREHIFNVIDVPADPAMRAGFVGAARFFIANPFYEALVVHLAEGTDAAAEEEFAFITSQGLLNPKGAIIHGISLTATDFQAMARNGTALIWSPRSNVELYGQTANIGAALDAGVEIALAPDWAITGSSNILDELKFAARWNREQLRGRLSDRQLVDMVTSTAAHVVGVDDEVGALTVGLRADIVVLAGDHNAPYAAVVNANPRDINLVMIAGTAIYGDRRLMERFWNGAALEALDIGGGAKALANAAAGVVVSELASRLTPALAAVGSSLAELTEDAPPTAPLVARAHR